MTYVSGSLDFTDGKYTIRGNSVLQVAREFTTPFYLYDVEQVVAQYTSLKEYITWDDLKIYYAMKANFSIPILKRLLSEGASVDTVSPAEVHLVQSLGFPNARILYTANNLTEDEMDEVHSLGVMFNIGSLSRLEKFAAAYPGSEVCLRFNPDVVAGEHSIVRTGGDLTKFGILLKDVEQVKDIVKRYNLKVVGLHEHTGSGIAETDKVYKSMQNLLSIATPENFPDLQFVDFGGGFKVPYAPDEKVIDYRSFGAEISRIFSEHCESTGRHLQMYFEPGKYLVAESGLLVLQVNTIKDNNGRLIAGTNSGFSHLIRPILYQAYHHIVNLSNPDGKLQKYDVCGNICETGDCFAVDRELPELREGDYIAILNAGAYCASMAAPYNLRPLPAEVVIEGDSVRLTKKAKTNAELAQQILGEYR